MRLYTRLRQWLRHPSTTASAALLFLVLGLIVVIYGFLTTQTDYSWRNLVDQLYSNFGIELVSISLTVLVIESLNQRRAIRERKEELILQLGSLSNDFALEAARILGQKGWLTDGSLQGANLFRANLSGANLWQANLSGANLKRANLSGAHLVEANLSGADLLGANLSGANLLGANLSGANLWQANLSGAQLLRANLSGAQLLRANLSGANLWQANLSGAQLGEAYLSGAQLSSTKFDENTTLPDEIKWTPDTDMTRFTDPEHPTFWRSDNPDSPPYRGKTE